MNATLTLNGFNGLNGFASKTNRRPIWWEEDGEIRFCIEHKPIRKGYWYTRLTNKGLTVYDKRFFFSVTGRSSGISAVSIIKGDIFDYDRLINESVFKEMNSRGKQRVTTDIGCLFFETFDEAAMDAMGFDSVVFVHPPMRNFDGNLSYMEVFRQCACRTHHGRRYLAPTSAQLIQRNVSRRGYAVLCGTVDC